MGHDTNADNPRAVPGNNQPPSLIDQTWSIYREVAEFAEGAPVITDEETAKQAKLLSDRAKIQLDEMEAERDGKVRPLNTQVKEINAEYKQPRETLEKLLAEVRARMAAWALAEERRKAAEAEALRKAAEEAERLAREAEAREREAKEDAAMGVVVDIGAAIGDADEAFADYERAQREAARAEREVKGRITGGLGRAFTLRTTETLTITDPVKVVVAIMEKAGRVPEKVTDALLSAARDFRKTFGQLPAGVSVEHSRG